MTPQEWHAIVDEVNRLWGKTAKWGKAKEDVWRFARTLDYQATHDTVTRLFESDRPNAPSPSEVISQTKTTGGTIPLDGECHHPNLAVTSWHDDGTGKDGLCARCLTVFRWPAGRIRSVGALEAAAKRRVAGEDRVPG